MGVDTTSGYWAGIGLWGDSAVSFKKDSLFLLTWRLLTGTLRKRFWLVAFAKREICQCGCHGRHTLSTIFDIAAWSMRALIAGEYPKVDHLGRAFPPTSYRGKLASMSKLPMQAAVLAKAGDWAWFKQALNLKSWSGEGEFQRICWLCEGAKLGPWPLLRLFSHSSMAQEQGGRQEALGIGACLRWVHFSDLRNTWIQHILLPA